MSKLQRIRIALSERGWHAAADWPRRSVFIAVPSGILSLASPRYRPLYSERNRKGGIVVIPLGGGWRIRWRPRR